MGSFHKTTTYKFPERLVLDTGPIPNHLRCLPRQPQHSWFQVAPTQITKWRLDLSLPNIFAALERHFGWNIDPILNRSHLHLLAPRNVPKVPERSGVCCSCGDDEVIVSWLGTPHTESASFSGLWIYDDGIFLHSMAKSPGQIYMYIHLYIYIHIKSLRWVYIYTSRIHLVMAFQVFFMFFQESFTYHLRGHKIMDVAVPSWSGA